MSIVPALDLRPVPSDPAPQHLPSNIEAEQALLGVLLYDNAAYERLSDRLNSVHFFEPFHQRLFAAMENHIRKGQLAEPILLADEFRADPAFQELGGLRYLADLVDRAPPAANAPDYARVVFELAVRRDLIRIGGEISAEAQAPDAERDSRDQIELAEQKLYNLAESGTASTGFMNFADALRGAVEMAAEAYSRDGGLAGISTGLVDLDQKMGGLHPSDLLILAGRPSMGKAQPLDAKILTGSGWTTMGRLRIGDRLASRDGACSLVSGIYPQGERQLYRVTLSDGRSTECCAEHLWRVHYRGWPEPRVLETAKIDEMLGRARYRGRLWIDSFQGDFSTAEALPMDAWALGVLLGDGKLSGGSASVSSADADLLEELQARLGGDLQLKAMGGYDYRIIQTQPHRRPGVQGVWPNPLKVALSDLGLWGLRSERKFVPAAYMTASRADRLALLRGLMDTDGWVEAWGSLRFCSTSERLAQDVQTLVRSVGGICTISTRQPQYTYKGEKRSGLTAYVCNIQHETPELFVGLSRKTSPVGVRQRQRRLTFASIQPTRVAEAQCIEVTHPDRLYVTDDFIVTHNTALATNIAFSVAKAYAWEPQPDGGKKTVSGGVVAFFSLEMSAEQLALRLLADASGVSGDRLRKGEIDASEFGRVRDAAMEIQEAPLFIDATGGLSIAKLVARARRLKRSVGLDLIVVDYLQLITGGEGKSDNRVQEVSMITQGLKALAKELSVPVLALSQLSRQVENREDKRPQLSDLRESGSIEQDADMVMFVYRESYYLGRAEPDTADSVKHLEWQEKMDRVAGMAEVVIGKQRHGPIGTVKLHFNEDLTKFGNLAREGRFEVR
jgi:replicative DNA helicase